MFPTRILWKRLRLKKSALVAIDSKPSSLSNFNILLSKIERITFYTGLLLAPAEHDVYL